MKVIINHGKVIGVSDEKHRIFCKAVKTEVHLYRKTSSWGIDAEYFEEVLLPKNYLVVITDETKRYVLTAKEMVEHGEYLEFNEYGRQIFIPRDLWITFG